MNKRYYSINDFYESTFKVKVAKIGIDGGFTCPNKDGKVGFGGCIYCSNGGSGYNLKPDDVITQFYRGKELIMKKWPKAKYIAYLQANTNTYADIDTLKEKYEPLLKLKDVIGLSIATRPDAITDECLDYLDNLNKRTFLTVELGLQTIHEKTAVLINRCHSLKCFEDMVYKLNARNIKVVVHIINGLPYETKKMMLETVKYLNTLPIFGIKFHMLYLTKDTRLASLYNEKPFKILTKEEYIDILVSQIALLRKDIVILRLVSGPDLKTLVAPLWLKKKFTILNEINKALETRDIYQGS